MGSPNAAKAPKYKWFMFRFVFNANKLDPHKPIAMLRGAGAQHGKNLLREEARVFRCLQRHMSSGQKNQLANDQFGRDLMDSLNSNRKQGPSFREGKKALPWYTWNMIPSRSRARLMRLTRGISLRFGFTCRSWNMDRDQTNSSWCRAKAEVDWRFSTWERSLILDPSKSGMSALFVATSYDAEYVTLFVHELFYNHL